MYFFLLENCQGSEFVIIFQKTYLSTFYMAQPTQPLSFMQMSAQLFYWYVNEHLLHLANFTDIGKQLASL